MSRIPVGGAGSVTVPGLTLASWNIQSGTGGDLAAAATALAVDVLGLQEVDVGQPRSGGVDQAAAVAEATGAVWWRYVPTVAGTPGQRWRPADDETATGPRFGVALLSRQPVRASRVLRLPGSPIPGVVVVPGARMPAPLRDEPRVVLATDVEVGAQRLTVATTHLSFVPGWNVVQLVRALRWLAAPGLPVVLLGDLNLPGPVVAVIAHGWRRLSVGPTYPAGRPRVALDHVLARRLDAQAQPRTVELAVGDHRPVVVALQARGDSGPEPR